MPKRTRDHQSWLLEKLSDPRRAAVYLNTALEDSQEMFLEALRDVAQAEGMSHVAREAGVTRKSLYNATSIAGNPTLGTLHSVLEALDLKLMVVANALEVANTPSSSSNTNIGVAIDLDIATPESSSISEDSANAGGAVFYFDTLQAGAGGPSCQHTGGLADLLNAPIKPQAFQSQSGALGPILKFLTEKEESDSRYALEI